MSSGKLHFSRAALQTRGTLTAPWMEDKPVPSSSSPSGSCSSLSVQEDTSSTELVRSGRLFDVNLRRSSAELSYGDTIKGPPIIPWHQTVLGQGQGKPSRSSCGWSGAPNPKTVRNVCSTFPGLQGYLKWQWCRPNLNPNQFFPPEESVS